jgi:predicted metallopeptidase
MPKTKFERRIGLKHINNESVNDVGNNIEDIRFGEQLGQAVQENGIQIPEAEDKFEPAPEVEHLARALIRQHHNHLINANIRYLFRRGSWTSKKRETLGQASKVSGVNEYLTGLDFIIMINIEVWGQLSLKEKVALVDHELEHCCEEDGKYFIQGHDVEDFLAVIQRNGFWTPDLRKLENEAVQGKLFESANSVKLEAVK